MNTRIFPSTRTDIVVAPGRAEPPPEIYTPVDCDFTDDLEFASVYRLRSEILFWNSELEVAVTEGIIKNIVTMKNKEEFLVLDDGSRIRLDHIQQIRILS